jgi:pyruvate carboxylase
MDIQPFRKVLCANRGEIAIRIFRACSELGIRTVAIFSEEDAPHQHRFKADEAYLVGQGKKPVDAYLGIDEILDIAQRAHADAIHPGYGFLAENAAFAEACRKRGIAFVGPRADVIRLLGDKVAARTKAVAVGVPVVPGMTLELDGDETTRQNQLADARAFFEEHAPVLVKAAHGGGGRGMRVVQRGQSLEEAIRQASSEAAAAFASPVVFLEKFLPRVRHIEVQVLGDLQGNLVHLGERDCSVQRRHQKLIELAPAPSISDRVRKRLWEDALKLCKAVGYHNAGTVEFLVAEDQHYFIEVNPRLQVEHTVTELVTGIDIVQAQLLAEQGHPLSSDEIGIHDQSNIRFHGAAIQCRVTTEDPENDFYPDTGTVTAYRPPGGFGIRLDAGDGYVGAKIGGFYDSLLVKVCAHDRDFRSAARRCLRAVAEFRIRGVKTNLPFLANVLQHETFLNGETYTRYVEETPQLFQFARSRDRATRLLNYLAEIVVNGHPTVPAEARRSATEFAEPEPPAVGDGPPPDGTAQILAERGPRGLAKWVREHTSPLLTDTTMRDAHQSLLATRLRTRDMLRIAPATAHLASSLFSLETWGGATFDVAYRFLYEDPWERLRRMKKAVPNILQQMLLRGANAVGYTSYPDNVVEAFIEEATASGIGVFRIFDSLNDLTNMQVAIDKVVGDDKAVAEVCICYTGDVANPDRHKYDLAYYVDLAKRIEDLGAHMLCIKDMAGLLRPLAARTLIGKLREELSIPLHLHTHDTSGNGIATLLESIEAGVDIVDVALAPMAGMTSQPSFNALVAALHGGPRSSGFYNRQLQPLADYWEQVREFYSPFECGLKSGTSEVYYHEIPGGQYSNLRPQVASLGLLGRWAEVKHAFAVVNKLVGDIPKVTPSSKMVGDFAIFLVQNELLRLTPGDFATSVESTRRVVLREAHRLDFPQSVVTYFQGHLGTPPGGFPEELRTAVLRGAPIVHGRPSASMEPLDLDALAAPIRARYDRPVARHEAVSAALYPRVYADWLDIRSRFGDLSALPTPNFFFGLEPEQEIWVKIEEGKTLVIVLKTVSEPRQDGTREVYFTLNGQGRNIRVRDKSLEVETVARRQADPDQPGEIGAPMPGTVLAVHCGEGEQVEEGAPLVTLEAMKMETVVRAPFAGTVSQILADVKDAVLGRDLLVVLGKA